MAPMTERLSDDGLSLRQSKMKSFTGSCSVGRIGRLRKRFTRPLSLALFNSPKISVHINFQYRNNEYVIQVSRMARSRH